MPTVEEMNVEIALYMGFAPCNINELTHHWNWHAILSVYGKLKEHDTGKFREHDRCLFDIKYGDIGHAILKLDITKAHRLIYEAIVWLKNK